MNIEIVFVWYFVIINITAFILMGIDKRRAIKHKWRISEKTLWITAIVGGSIGAIIGMYLFRHKTKRRLFTIGMPIILGIQVAAVLIIL